MTWTSRHRRWLSGAACFLFALIAVFALFAAPALAADPSGPPTDYAKFDRSINTTSVITVAPGSASDLADMYRSYDAPDSGGSRKVTIVNKGILITGHGNTVVIEKRSVYDRQPGERTTMSASVKRRPGISEDCEHLYDGYLSTNARWTSAFNR